MSADTNSASPDNPANVPSLESDPPIPTQVSQPDGTYVAHTVDRYGDERTITFDTEQVHRDSPPPPEPTLTPVAELDLLVHRMADEAPGPAPTVVMSEDGVWHSTRVDEYGNVREVSTSYEGFTRIVEEPRVVIHDTEIVMRGEPSDHPETFQVVHEAAADSDDSASHHAQAATPSHHGDDGTGTSHEQSHGGAESGGE